jgi:soluble lytic murein transglycosylase-like protein
MEPATRDRVAGAIVGASERVGVPASWLLASAYWESRFQPRARSGVGASGAWQQMPQFSGYYSDACAGTDERPSCSWSVASAHNLTPDELNADVEQTARIAARHLRYLLERYGMTQMIGRYARGSTWDDERGRAYTLKWADKVRWFQSHGVP